MVKLWCKCRFREGDFFFLFFSEPSVEMLLIYIFRTGLCNNFSGSSSAGESQTWLQVGRWSTIWGGSLQASARCLPHFWPVTSLWKGCRQKESFPTGINWVPTLYGHTNLFNWNLRWGMFPCGLLAVRKSVPPIVCEAPVCPNEILPSRTYTSPQEVTDQNEIQTCLSNVMRISEHSLWGNTRLARSSLLSSPLSSLCCTSQGRAPRCVQSHMISGHSSAILYFFFPCCVWLTFESTRCRVV